MASAARSASAASDKHQAVQHALLNALSEAARKHDQGKGTSRSASSSGNCQSGRTSGWGIGTDVAAIIEDSFGDFIGSRWEEAFRRHLALAAMEGPRLRPVSGIGSFWKTGTQGDADPCEIEAVIGIGLSCRAALWIRCAFHLGRVS